MGFLKRLFGGGDQPQNQDPNGIYLYFRSKRAANAVAKVRIDKQYDLNRSGDGFVWHKTIVDPRYFSRIEAVITFDSRHNIVNADLSGGELIDEESYEAAMTED
ncbi:MAG: hypothetical protein QNJ45_14530 [Ardenticatenaceae bacterium]|nr:hypothetical protein [Ardenticatenaceae bacterium]